MSNNALILRFLKILDDIVAGAYTKGANNINAIDYEEFRRNLIAKIVDLEKHMRRNGDPIEMSYEDEDDE